MRNKIAVLLSLTCLLSLLTGCEQKKPETEWNKPVLKTETPVVPVESPEEALEAMHDEPKVELQPLAPPAAVTDHGLTAEALAVFDSVLANSAVYGHAVSSEALLLADSRGRILMPLRTEEGGIPAVSAAVLVYDPKTEAVTTLDYAWIRQGGFDLGKTVTKYSPETGLRFRVPVEAMGEVSVNTIAGRSWPAFFTCAIDSTDNGDGVYLELARRSRTELEDQDWSSYPRWADEVWGAQGWHVARDEGYCYILHRATDVQFNYEDPEERAWYHLREQESEFWAVQFLLDNRLDMNLLWYLPSKGYTSTPEGLRSLLCNVLVEEDMAYLTIPKGFPYLEPGADFSAWTMDLTADWSDGNGPQTIPIVPPEGGWQPGTTYGLPLTDLYLAKLTAGLPDCPAYTVTLQGQPKGRPLGEDTIQVNDLVFTDSQLMDLVEGMEIGLAGDFVFQDASELSSEALYTCFQLLTPSETLLACWDESFQAYVYPEALIRTTLDRHFLGYVFDITQCRWYDNQADAILSPVCGGFGGGFFPRMVEKSVEGSTVTFVLELCNDDDETVRATKEYKIEFSDGGYYYLSAQERT